MIKTYKKRPVSIEACIWEGGNFQELRNFTGGSVKHTGYNNELSIFTLEDGTNGEAKHVASLGDYIIKGVKGEFYACKPDIFKMTYEEEE